MSQPSFSSSILASFLSTTVFAVSVLLLVAASGDDSGKVGHPSRQLAITSIENDLEFDENNKLSSFYLVYPANQSENCGIEIRSSVTAYKSEALDGDALERVFPDFQQTSDTDNSRCLAACLEKGTDKSVAGYTMPHLHYHESIADVPSKFSHWFNSKCRKVEVCLLNYVTRERPLVVYWLGLSGGEKHFQHKLEYGERKTNCFHSFIGHEFVAIDEESGFEEHIVIEHVTTKAFGASPPSSSQKFDGREDLEKQVEKTLQTEWSKHFMVKRTFTSLGFDKGRLPNDVYANMISFYYNNRHNIVNEEWGGKGLFVNWWDTDVKFITIPWSLKHIWQERLKELVSLWAGVEVEQTSMYGLRQYETGARLLSHVDRLPTHAVSLIVNIAQDNLSQPWPVEVFDHADRLHEITMDPGEIVYYESAKNLHGRNRPLTCKAGGCSFVNLFTHYRPVSDGSKWHRNLDDMPNRPPPLLKGQVDFDDDSRYCTLPEEFNSSHGGIGAGTVKCNDSRLGPYISPTLYKANSAQDLFMWWKSTHDPNFIKGVRDDGTWTDEYVNTNGGDNKYDDKNANYNKDDDGDDGSVNGDEL